MKDDTEIKKQDQDFLLRYALLRFFLMITKYQLGLPPKTKSGFYPINTDAYTYELWAEFESHKKTRRISIYPLGEGSGSKSKCYLVTFYHLHLVIKIPPRPLTDLTAYLKGIDAESEIVKKLDPQQCMGIIPEVSIILKRIYNFFNSLDLSPDELEDKYKQMLKGDLVVAESKVAFLKYIQIGGTVPRTYLLKWVPMKSKLPLFFENPDDEDLIPKGKPAELLELIKSNFSDDKRKARFLYMLEQCRQTLVYFMNLSDYHFLGEYIRELYEDRRLKLIREILDSPGVIWEYEGLEGRYGYGPANEKIYDQIHTVYAEYCKKTDPKLRQFGTKIPLSKSRQWFLMHLAGSQIPLNDPEVPPELAGELNGLTQQLVTKHQGAINAYRRMVLEYIERVGFSKNKPKMEAISANLLEFLSILRESRVVMRDLKPDNLILVGDPQNYSHFLLTPERFAIGVIDLEMAIDLDRIEDDAFKAMLGGSSFYATPSHLFDNEALRELGDLERVYYYQDLQAVLAMCFRLFTGEHLFRQTARYFGEMILISRRENAAGSPPKDVLRNVSLDFWKMGTEEFGAKLEKYNNILKSIQITLLERGRELIAHEMRIEQQRMQYIVNRNQVVVANAKHREKLFWSVTQDPEAVQRLLKRWENGQHYPDVSTAVRAKMVKLLYALLRLEYWKKWRAIFENENVRVNAIELLSLLYKLISGVMLPIAWLGGPTKPGKVRHIPESMADEATIEHTIEETSKEITSTRI